MTGPWRGWLPCNLWVRMAIVPALVFIALATDRGYLADFWHHLARGRAIVEQGEIIDRDLFTYTIPGQSFLDVNWLSQDFYFALFEQGGLALVRVLNALLLAVAFGWLVVLCRRVSGSLALAAAVAVVAFFGVWQVLTIRPQTFSLLLFVVLLDFLERAESRPSWLLPVPFLFALWANLHGAFPAGIVLIGCFLLASAWQGWKEGRLAWVACFRGSLAQKESCARPPRKHATRQTWLLAGCFTASLLATLVNPYGWRIYQFVGLNSYRSATRQVDEWLPPNLDMWIGKAWLASLLAMAALFLFRWRWLRRGARARDLVMVVCFLPLACRSVRMVPWWLFVCAPMAACWLAELLPHCQDNVEEARQPSWAAGLILGITLLFTVFSMPGLQEYNPLLAGRLAAPRVEDHLEEVHQFLAARDTGPRIFSHFEWGEYLSWAFSPRYRVFMDGRIDIFPDAVWDQYSAITLGKAPWQQILDDYRVNVLLLDTDFHARTGLLARVEASRHWQQSFRSGPAVVYLRTQ